MYLEPETAAQTFAVIGEYAGKGSRVLFDYVQASALRGENRYYGEGVTERVTRVGEQWRFGLDNSQVNPFLGQYGFEVCEHQCAEDLENKYFKDAAGRIAARINGTHCIVVGEKS